MHTVTDANNYDHLYADVETENINSNSILAEILESTAFNTDPLAHIETTDNNNGDIYASLLSQYLSPKTIFDAKQPINSEMASGDTVHIGIDVETTYTDETKQNSILSYQYCIETNGKYLKGIHYPKSSAKKHRLKFNSFIGDIIHKAKKAGVIEKYPAQILIFGHFLRADFVNFSDFWAEHKTKVSGMRRTVTSLKGAYAVNFDNIGSRRAGNDAMVLRDQNRKAFVSKVRFIDTLPLTPGGAGLAAVGELIGLPKLELPTGYNKADMHKFLEDQKPLFEAYAIRDAEIAVRYGMLMLEFAKELKLRKLPSTIGSIAVSVFKQSFESLDGCDYKAVFGLTEETVEYWNRHSGRPHTTKQLTPNAARALFEELAIRCYHGGRNECFTCGPSPIGTFSDFDLHGAYTTGMCDLLFLDYAKAYMVTNPLLFKGHVCGFARVNFKFPNGTQYPCLPVRHQRYGLIFPISGTSYCTAPELEVALNQGCEIEVLQGVIIPWVPNSIRLFEPFVRLVRHKRDSYPKKSFEEQLWKEIGNSLYGKTGQGLKERTAFDTASGLSKKIPPSAVTNPYMASHTTGFIRAVVSELLATVPSDRSVISVTTDGFLTDATEAELALTGPLCSRFNRLCQLIGGQ